MLFSRRAWRPLRSFVHSHTGILLRISQRRLVILFSQSEGDTALILAAFNDKLDAIHWLLNEAKADANQRNPKVPVAMSGLSWLPAGISLNV